jgi:hypothetical protein
VETRRSFLLTEPMLIMDLSLRSSNSRREERPWKPIPNTLAGLCDESFSKVVLVCVLRGDSVVLHFVAAAHHDGEPGAGLFAVLKVS